MPGKCPIMPCCVSGLQNPRATYDPHKLTPGDEVRRTHTLGSECGLQQCIELPVVVYFTSCLMLYDIINTIFSFSNSQCSPKFGDASVFTIKIC